jgi:hypothetical protein
MSVYLSVCVTGMHVESMPVETVLQHIVGSLPPFMLSHQMHIVSVPVSLYIASLFLSQDRTPPTCVQTETVCVLVSTQT